MRWQSSGMTFINCYTERAWRTLRREISPPNVDKSCRWWSSSDRRKEVALTGLLSTRSVSQRKGSGADVWVITQFIDGLIGGLISVFEFYCAKSMS